MRQFSMAVAIALPLAATGLPAWATEVGVSVQISQPGVYGRIDIGSYPRPMVVLAQPVVIVRPAVAVQPQPVYLWVPPGHRKDWRRHCNDYGACGVPVYFVQQGWYDEHVMKGKGQGKGKDKDNDHGKGQGKGHGKGHED